MKRKSFLSAFIAVILFVATLLPATAAQSLTLIVNGVKADVQPQLINGTTYVPVRAAAELLGAEVNYVASTKTVIITSAGAQQQTADNPKNALVVNGKVADVKPTVINGSTYVPVRAAAELLGAEVKYDAKTYTVTITSGAANYDVTITFPADRYPQTAAHIKAAIANGESAICTIDRDGADANREESLAGIPTKDGYDRDEWPMAMCAEGGAGADVAYVESSDNRGAGAWVGNALEDYADGTRVLFVITGGMTNENVEEAPAPVQPAENVTYANCTAVREAGKAPLYKGDPGYSTKLDRDGDGVACEAS